MAQSIPAQRIAALTRGFHRAPAYAGLADALTLLIGDGRLPLGAKLPSERDLTRTLGVSRTTVTRAYQVMRDSGFAVARHGAGTFTAVPVERARAHDRVLSPWAERPGIIDLNCAASTAPPEIATAYAAAVADLPTYLGGNGYFPAGVPALQEAVALAYERRGLPTSPAQIVVTPGALSAAAFVFHALLRRGDRVVLETPVYPNAVQALRNAGARLVESAVDAESWDVEALATTVESTSPALGYFIPDFQNPTGHLMTNEQRARLAAALGRVGAVAVIDEAHVGVNLDDLDMPLPFAAFAPNAVLVGSASKSFWGGLRVGWIRATPPVLERITHARFSLDLGVPVVEQLAVTRLLEQGGASRAHLARLRRQRDALVRGVSAELPGWRFTPPPGGLSLWCELPGPDATTLAARAEARGVVVAPGPLFAVGGGLNRFVRLPWTRPEPEIATALDVLREVWNGIVSGARADKVRGRALVA